MVSCGKKLSESGLKKCAFGVKVLCDRVAVEGSVDVASERLCGSVVYGVGVCESVDVDGTCVGGREGERDVRVCGCDATQRERQCWDGCEAGQHGVWRGVQRPGKEDGGECVPRCERVDSCERSVRGAVVEGDACGECGRGFEGERCDGGAWEGEQRWCGERMLQGVCGQQNEGDGKCECGCCSSERWKTQDRNGIRIPLLIVSVCNKHKFTLFITISSLAHFLLTLCVGLLFLLRRDCLSCVCFNLLLQQLCGDGLFLVILVNVFEEHRSTIQRVDAQLQKSRCFDELSSLPMPYLGDFGKDIGEIVVDMSHGHSDDVGSHDFPIGDVMEDYQNKRKIGSFHGNHDELDVDVGILPAPDINNHRVKRHA